MIIQDLVTWTSCKQWWCVWRTRWRCFRQDRLHFRSCWCWCQKGLQELYHPLSQNIFAPPVTSFAQLSWTNVDEDDIIVRSNVLDHSVDRVHHLNPDEVDPVQPRDGLVQLGLVHLPSWCEMMMMMFSWVWAWCQRVTIMFWNKLGCPNKYQSHSGRPASPAIQWSTRRKGGGWRALRFWLPACPFLGYFWDILGFIFTCPLLGYFCDILGYIYLPIGERPRNFFTFFRNLWPGSESWGGSTFSLSSEQVFPHLAWGSESFTDRLTIALRLCLCRLLLPYFHLLRHCLGTAAHAEDDVEDIFFKTKKFLNLSASYMVTWPFWKLCCLLSRPRSWRENWSSMAKLAKKCKL